MLEARAAKVEATLANVMTILGKVVGGVSPAAHYNNMACHKLFLFHFSLYIYRRLGGESGSGPNREIFTAATYLRVFWR